MGSGMMGKEPFYPDKAGEVEEGPLHQQVTRKRHEGR